MGSPLEENPAGTEIPGIPAILAERVKISLKYMVNGSSLFSPILKAGDGATGDKIKSQVSKALEKSSMISVRTWDAFP